LVGVNSVDDHVEVSIYEPQILVLSILTEDLSRVSRNSQ
jgi:hypothetical protein